MKPQAFQKSFLGPGRHKWQGLPPGQPVGSQSRDRPGLTLPSPIPPLSLTPAHFLAEACCVAHVGLWTKNQPARLSIYHPFSPIHRQVGDHRRWPSPSVSVSSSPAPPWTCIQREMKRILCMVTQTELTMARCGTWPAPQLLFPSH